MRYCFTDFFPWEKEIMARAYKEAGLFLYSLIDTGGTGYLITHGFANRFGYVILDHELPQKELTDAEFFALNPMEDSSLNLRDKYITEIEQAKKSWHVKSFEVG